MLSLSHLLVDSFDLFLRFSRNLAMKSFVENLFYNLDLNFDQAIKVMLMRVKSMKDIKFIKSWLDQKLWALSLGRDSGV